MRELDWPEWSRKRDPELYDHYAQHVLEPGWPGHLTEAEYKFIRDRLLKNRRLRARWGFSDEDTLSFKTIQAVALWGLPDDRTHNAWLIHSALSRRTARRDVA